MEQEIKDVIEKNLPKHIGEVLSKRLQVAAQVEADNKTLKETNATLEKNFSKIQIEMHNVMAEVNALRQKHVDIERREKELVAKETKIELVERNALHQEQRVQDHKDMMNTVFRNTIVRETVQKSSGGSDYNQSTGQNTSKSLTGQEERTVEKQ